MERTGQAALTFDFSPAAGTPQRVIDGFLEAGRLWSTLLEDDLTVRLDVSFEAIADPRVLGFADSADFTSSYSTVRDALSTDALTADDASTVAHLLPGGNLSMLINYTSNNPNGAGSAVPYLDNSGLNTSTIRLTRAGAKAMGLVPGTSGVSDGTITFDSTASWDFDRSNGISFGANDFIGAAAHEIGHVLGFRSGVDFLDQNSPASGGGFLSDNTLREVTATDLFRFSTASVAQGVGVIDWTAGTPDKYFSVDGGQTKLVSFATGAVHGDGQQASHWKDGRGIGLMDPSLAPREFRSITENDVRLFDAIGWNRNFNKTWNTSSGGLFGAVENWIGGVPTTSHTALFDVPGEFVVTFNGVDAASQQLRVADGDVNFSLGGATYALSDPGDAIVIADASGQTARLTVRTGTLAATSASVARSVGADGELIVSGASAELNLSGDLYVGGDAGGAGGTAALVARTSGTIAAQGMLQVWNNGTVNLEGGMIEATTLNVEGGLLTGLGRISGSTNTPTTLINGGRIEPGNTFGVIEVEGDYTQLVSGALNLEIGGLVAGVDYDQLQVAGIADLAGVLNVSLVDGFGPQAGDRFALLGFAAGNGMFDVLNLPSLSGGLTWALDYGASEFALLAVGATLGDTDDDGDVDIDDLNNVRNHFGAVGVPVSGDTDDDGDVDIDDLNNVRNHFGSVGAAPVPEPHAAWLALLAFGWLARVRQRAADPGVSVGRVRPL